jgi:aspartyl-tRNA(Asn)/glutamyl-tRNA(Gln) amidotransferase subunit B
LLSEIERQTKVLDAGGTVQQQTVGWRDDLGRTEPQRLKEEAHDYRYFPEPDLPLFVMSRARIEELRSRLPELPGAKRERFMDQYGLPFYDAHLLTEDPTLAEYFEECARLYPQAKALSNWITGELFHLLKTSGLEIGMVKVRPAQLAELLKVLDEGRINISTAKVVFEEMFATGRSAEDIISERDLTQISGADELSTTVAQVLEENPQAVADYLGGKTQVVRFLVGQVMKATRGKANPQMVDQLLTEKLKAMDEG